ncbi:MAG TPA: BMC domain-containing protein [Pirellulaceae bacterium]|nr:BMC domain-containing protein [Pirellulaceae bacterium]
MATALGLLEIRGFTPGMVALDAMDKAANIGILQVEMNDFYGVVIKVTGNSAEVAAAVEAGKKIAEQMGGQPIGTVLNRPDDLTMGVVNSPSEVSALTGQDVVLRARSADPSSSLEDSTVAETTSFALGLIETQGFTAVFEAIDSACKAANVEVLCKEKLGGGYITVVLKGDVAAVKAAVEAGQAKVGALGKLIAAHVIARPSAGVLALLPK